MKQAKAYIGYIVLALTLFVFAWYIRTNPEVIDQLRQTKLTTIAAILGLYSLMTALLVVIFSLMLRICNASISPKENILFTMYSSVVNFFGPMQSGPGFRLVYLKKRFNISMRAYASANLLYYLYFAIISGTFLLSSVTPLWALVITAIAGLSIIWQLLPALSKFSLVKKWIPLKVNLKLWAAMAIATTMQLLLIATIYFVQLSSISPGVTFSQAITYAGAANFSLFVSLTPGALGFRESFLFLSERLHHIDQTTVISANILDRAVYVLFLGILFLIIVAMHGREKLSKFKATKDQQPVD